MEQEDRELLLKDLCVRLPYGVRIARGQFDTEGITLNSISIVEIGKMLNGYYTEGIPLREDGKDELWPKPYLRSMSSMTNEEEEELEKVDELSSRIFFDDLYGRTEKEGRENRKGFLPDYPTLDWLNEHHFDYRGLIETGLALQAPDGMYN